MALLLNSVLKVQIAHGVKYLTIVFSSVLSFLPYCGGVTVGNLIQGTPIDEAMTYVGTFWDLLSPYAVLCGVAFVLVFT